MEPKKIGVKKNTKPYILNVYLKYVIEPNNNNNNKFKFQTEKIKKKKNIS